MQIRILPLTVLLAGLLSSTAFAAHPLITDDTGTQGKGKFQLEVNGELSRQKNEGDEGTTRESAKEVSTAITYGIIDNLDVALGLPYQWKWERGGETEPRTKGFADIPLQLKWRCYEKEGLSFAVKPEIDFSTGDENKRLGNGRTSYSFTFITTKEAEPWAFHLNLGYTHNVFKLQEDKEANRQGIWHVSLATGIEILKDLTVVADTGIENNSDRTSNSNPVFLLGGVIYSISKDFDVDLGVKRTFSRHVTDYSILPGLAWRF